MGSEQPEFMQYPNFTSTNYVIRAYTMEKLKVILADCCLTVSCSPTKGKLV